MKNLEKKPFEECKIELIELGDDVLTVSAENRPWQSDGGGWHGPEYDEEG